MADNYGMIKPELELLPQIKDRMTFIYLERCRISRNDSAIKVIDDTGIVHIPAAYITVLLLGPGTDISHRAIELIGDSGVSIVWIGEHGVRYYAHGRALNAHTRLLVKQAELVSNTRKHLAVVRKMYMMRFGDSEDISRLSLQQLRGREGSRMRMEYRKYSKKYGVPWSGRNYDPNDFQAGDPVNQALSTGNVCLYGLAHAVISALGCSAGLGFIHVGHEWSFAYDVADLYKTETTIPIAFEMAAELQKDGKKPSSEFAGKVRRRVRDKIVDIHLLEKMVSDIKYLLLDEDANTENESVYFWDNLKGVVANGIQYREYGKENESDDEFDFAEYDDDAEDSDDSNNDE